MAIAGINPERAAAASALRQAAEIYDDEAAGVVDEPWVIRDWLLDLAQDAEYGHPLVRRPDLR